MTYKLKKNEPLKLRTTFKIGGYASLWYEPKDVKELVRFLKETGEDVPLFMIGAGSNILVKEGVIKKTFIHLAAPSFQEVSVKGDLVSAGAGVKIGRFVSVLGSKGLCGYEFLTGIPGTVGGALAMNAGAKMGPGDAPYREMKDIVVRVEALDRHGRFLSLKKEELEFSYRRSNLKDLFVVSADFKFEKAKQREVQERIRQILVERLNKQDWRYPSAGSFFKNPSPAQPAGFLIDQCGLKGAKVGGAQVSDKHANFIVNVGSAQSCDVIRLMEKIKKRVYNRFKIELEPEVQIVS